jgi:hypothetical protein
MKIKHVKTLKNGKRHALVELDPGEHITSYRPASKPFDPATAPSAPF